MKTLFEALVTVSEKAANVARVCRQNDHLFSLLVEQKSCKEANPRFIEDFKTLADVLIQETVMHDIGNQFPDLIPHIRGEENNTFSNTLGDSITVKVHDSKEETSLLLQQVLCGDVIAADLLAEEVHRDINIDDIEIKYNKDTTKWPEYMEDQLGIWIDPIDSTAEYINGTVTPSDVERLNSRGLCCATVLLGVYHRNTGEPLLGVINQPFHTQNGHKWSGNIYWGFSHNETAMSSQWPSLPELASQTMKRPIVVALSSSEDAQLLQMFAQNAVKSVSLAGAGYKALSVITEQTDCYVLSKGSTYKWDTCGPHAILKSLGGGIVDYDAAVNSKADARDCQIKYDNGGTCNAKGVIAYRDESVLDVLLGVLRNNE